MPETTYERDLSAFTNGIDCAFFAQQIEADSGIAPSVVRLPVVTVVADVGKVRTTFTDALTAGEETTFDGLIAAHDPAAMPSLPSEQVYHQEQHTLANGADVTITHLADMGTDPSRRVNIWKREPNLGSNLALACTPLDESHSSTEANLNDGNQTSFAYNNSGRGPAGKGFRLDAGTAITATHVRWFDYTTNAYGASEYKIQGSDDNSTWTDLAHVTGNIPHFPPGSAGHLVPLGGAHTYRYWRYLCVVGRNSSYFIVNELELYNVVGEDPWVPAEADVVVKSVSASQTLICNTSGAEKTFLVTIMVPR